MGFEATKLELIEWLANLDDEATIEYLKVVKDSKTEKDWWEELTPEQKLGLGRGLKDVDEGLVVSHEEGRKRFGL